MYGRSHCNPYSTATNSSQVHSQTITWCCCPKCVLKCFSSPWCWWWLVFASDLFSSSLIKCEKPALIWGYLGTSLGKSGDYCDRPAYHTIPQHTVPYQTKPNHTKPNHSIIVKPTIPYHTKACHTIPYHTIPYQTKPYQKAKHSIIVTAHQISARASTLSFLSVIHSQSPSIYINHLDISHLHISHLDISHPDISHLDISLLDINHLDISHLDISHQA